MTSLLLVHDLLLSKSGIATHASHPLRLAIERHKARLQAELTRSRLRRGCATLEELKHKLASERPVESDGREVQWIRINTIRTTLEQELASTFQDFSASEDLVSLCFDVSEKKLFIDETVPNLVAVSRSYLSEIAKSVAFQEGRVILQDKASCFPAYLLLHSSIDIRAKDVLDTCAAPGNKTTHLAMLYQQLHSTGGKILACERDELRTETLKQMIRDARADSLVTVFGNEDFLALDPKSSRLAKVTHLLIDPSCSGSGITNRDDIPSLALPSNPNPTEIETPRSKKRRLSERHLTSETEGSSETKAAPLQPLRESVRLQKLSNLQTRIIIHAFTLPGATVITYSTCSIHVIENECVVSRALMSDIAKQRGWRVMRRDEQVPGLKNWAQRGQESDEHGLQAWERNACLRCSPGDESRTIGFFVCGFVRDNRDGISRSQLSEDVDSEWEGLSDRS